MRWIFLLVGLLLPLQALAQGEFLEGRQSGFAVGVGAASIDRHMLYSTAGGYSWRSTIDLSLSVGRFNQEGPNRTLGAVQLGIWPIRQKMYGSALSITCYASAQFIGPVSSYGPGIGLVKRIPLSDARVSGNSAFLLPSFAFAYQLSSGGRSASQSLWSASGALSVGIPAGQTSWLAITGQFSKSFNGYHDSGPALGIAVTYVNGFPWKGYEDEDDTEW